MGHDRRHAEQGELLGGARLARVDDHAARVVARRSRRRPVQERPAVGVLPHEVVAEVAEAYERVLGDDPLRRALERGVLRGRLVRVQEVLRREHRELEEGHDERHAEDGRDGHPPRSAAAARPPPARRPAGARARRAG